MPRPESVLRSRSATTIDRPPSTQTPSAGIIEIVLADTSCFGWSPHPTCTSPWTWTSATTSTHNNTTWLRPHAIGQVHRAGAHYEPSKWKRPRETTAPPEHTAGRSATICAAPLPPCVPRPTPSALSSTPSAENAGDTFGPRCPYGPDGGRNKRWQSKQKERRAEMEARCCLAPF